MTAYYPPLPRRHSRATFALIGFVGGLSLAAGSALLVTALTPRLPETQKIGLVCFDTGPALAPDDGLRPASMNRATARLFCSGGVK